MPDFIPNQFLSGIIDIVDALPFPQYASGNKEYDESYNRLRKALGKPPLRTHPRPQPLNAAGYFDGSLTSNPPTTSTSGGTITSTGQFQNGRWVLAPSTKVHFTYHQNAFQTAFAPVTCRITGTPTEATKVTLTVNKIVVFDKHEIYAAKSDVDGAYDLFVPAPCFLGGLNDFELKVDAGSFPVTRIQVIDANSTGDLDSNIRVLEQMLIRMGNENFKVTNTWRDVIDTLNRHTLLQRFVAQGTSLRNEFDSLKTGMRQVAIDLRSFCSYYADTYFGAFASTKNSVEDKQAVVDWLKPRVADNKSTATTTVRALQLYKDRVHAFGKEVEEVASQAMKDIQAELEQIRNDLIVVELEMDRLRQLIIAYGSALAGSIVAGIIGGALFIFGGPIGMAVGALLAITGLIAGAVSLGFLITYLIELNKKELEKAQLLQRKEDALARQADIKAMLSDVATIQESLENIAQHSNGFIHIWEFIERQMEMLAGELRNAPVDAPPVLDVLPKFEAELQAYFKRIDRILEAYIVNF